MKRITIGTPRDTNSRCILRKNLCLYYIRSGNEIDLFHSLMVPFLISFTQQQKRRIVEGKKSSRVAIAEENDDERKRKSFPTPLLRMKSLIRMEKKKKKFPYNSLLAMREGEENVPFRLLAFFSLYTLTHTPHRTHTTYIFSMKNNRQQTSSFMESSWLIALA